MQLVKLILRRQASLRGGLLLAGLFLTSLLHISTKSVFAAVDCSDVDNLALHCLEGVFENVLKGALSLVGILSFLFIIRGGVAYATAGGDIKAMDSARKTLTWSGFGLLFAILAYFILEQLNTTFGASILRFVIPEPGQPIS